MHLTQPMLTRITHEVYRWSMLQNHSECIVSICMDTVPLFTLTVGLSGVKLAKFTQIQKLKIKTVFEQGLDDSMKPLKLYPDLKNEGYSTGAVRKGSYIYAVHSGSERFDRYVSDELSILHTSLLKTGHLAPSPS